MYSKLCQINDNSNSNYINLNTYNDACTLYLIIH